MRTCYSALICNVQKGSKNGTEVSTIGQSSSGSAAEEQVLDVMDVLHVSVNEIYTYFGIDAFERF